MHSYVVVYLDHVSYVEVGENVGGTDVGENVGGTGVGDIVGLSSINKKQKFLKMTN